MRLVSSRVVRRLGRVFERRETVLLLVRYLCIQILHSFILQRTLFLHRSLFSTLDRSRGDPDDGEVAASRGIDDDVARGGAKFTLRLGERVDGAPSSAG